MLWACGVIQITAHPPVILFGQTGLGHRPSSMELVSTVLPLGQASNGG